MQDQLRQDEKKEYKLGLSYALGAAVLWGLLPIYWKSLVPISSSIIILYRVFLAGIISFFAALFGFGLKGILEPLKQKGVVPKLILAGLLITGNWSIYIYAVNANYVVQTSIGYYIEPLVVCIFGILLFKERPTKTKIIALSFASLGVLIILIYFRQLPVLALSLAFTFAIYTALKKHLKVPAFISMFYETVLQMPIALGLILYAECTGKGALAQGQPYQFGLLLLAGILTAIPLGFFSMAANRINLITLGITGYIAPSITLMLGIFLYKEPFDLIRLIAFIVIWAGLVVFTFGEVKEGKEHQKAPGM